jgi:hypothetical protein
LERIARTSYRHRWVVLIKRGSSPSIAAVSVGRCACERDFFASGGKLPTPSRRAFGLLESLLPRAAGDGGTIVFKAEQGVTDPQVQAAMEAMFASHTGAGRDRRREPVLQRGPEPDLEGRHDARCR